MRRALIVVALLAVIVAIPLYGRLRNDAVEAVVPKIPFGCSDSGVLKNLEGIHRKAFDGQIASTYEKIFQDGISPVRAMAAYTANDSARAAAKRAIDSAHAILEDSVRSIQKHTTYRYENIVTLVRDTTTPSVTCQVEVTATIPGTEASEPQISVYTVRLTDDHRLYITTAPLK